MTHLTDLQCAMFSDGELPALGLQEVNDHAAVCTDCNARLQAFVGERKIVEAVVQMPEPVAVPKFKRPVGLREFALANLATGAIAVVVPMFWKLIYGSLLDEAFARVVSLLLPDEYSVLVDTFLLSLQEETTMLSVYLGYVFWIVAVMACLWGAIVLRDRIRGFTALASAVAVVFLAMPVDVQALEVRKDEKAITISKNEVIEDTLMVNGDSVTIDGTIDGDLFVAAERVVINGVVTGNLFLATESGTISGRIEGTAIMFGASIDLIGGEIVGDLWSAGEGITMNSESVIGGSVTLGAERVSVAGEVKRDLTTFTSHVDLAGRVGRDFVAYAESVTLLDGSYVAGDLQYFVETEEKLSRAATAIVIGDVITESLGLDIERNKYLRGDFYIYQVLWLVSALMLGMLLLWFVPVVRYVELEGGAAGIFTGLFGLAAYIALPVMMVLLAVTVIGIPLAGIALFTWLALLYFAKIVLAIVVGQMILGEPEEDTSYFRPLLVGLVVILVLVNIPVAGGVLNTLLSCVGAGLMVKMIMEYVSDLSAES